MFLHYLALGAAALQQHLFNILSVLNKPNVHFILYSTLLLSLQHFSNIESAAPLFYVWGPTAA